MAHPPVEIQIAFLYTWDMAETAQFCEKMLDLPLRLDHFSVDSRT